jgi:hypothetical protein
MKIFRFLLVCIAFLPLFVAAQENYDPEMKGSRETIRVALTMVDGELIPWATLQEVKIIDSRIFRTPEQQAAYNRLKYNVMKVLPYAMYARSRYAQLQNDLANAKSTKEERQLTKAFENEIKDMFHREIKNLTINQGGILIKLIDRETGYSSYEILKDMKGGLTAFLYQSVARVFGNNLKNRYDLQEDRDIESIIQQTPYYRYSTM